MNTKKILGVVYRKNLPYWKKLDYLLSELNKFDLNVKLIDLEEKSEFPSDLDIVTLLPADHEVLPEIINTNKNLKWVHSIFAGVDKFQNKAELMENDNITLTNAKGAYATSLAEFSIFAMLYYSFNTPVFLKAFNERKWVTPLSTTLKGKTVSIVGYGMNGIAIAKRAKHGFSMNVIGVKKPLFNT